MSEYYQACTDRGNGAVEWSSHTRKTFDGAAREARSMARRLGGKPAVAWWDRSHGMRPGDCEVHKLTDGGQDREVDPAIMRAWKAMGLPDRSVKVSLEGYAL